MRTKRAMSLFVALTMIISVFGALTITTEAASMDDSTFFAKFNYSAYPGLSAVKAAVDSGDYDTAKKELLNYYRQRTINGDVKAFDITEKDANIGMANLARDFIITGPYEFDVWVDTVKVTNKNMTEYTADGDEVTTHVKSEVDNKSISFMLFERQKQQYPIYVASRESENSPKLVVTLEDGEVITIVPDKDTFIHSGSTGTNYGSATELEIKEQSDNIADAFGSQTRRAYVNFPLTQLAGKDIEKAELKFTAKLAADCTAEYLEFHILSVGDTTWSENGFTWNSTNGIGNTYSWQNSESGPWWVKPSGCDSEYRNVALRYWYARPMVWEYLKYENDPEGYPEGKEYGEKILVLMNAITQKFDQTTGESTRTIEFGERNNRWVDVLYNLLPTDVLDPDKNPKAAEYFFNIVNYMWGDMNFTRNTSNLGWSNWGAVFLAGMQKAYDFFPEFTDYSDWREYNVSRLTAKFKELYNSDMSFTESGPAYAIWCAELFGDAYRMAELNGKSLSNEYKTMLIYATRFAMECAYPNGYDTNIGDSNFRPRMDKFETLEAVLNDPHITNFVTGGKEGKAEYYTKFYNNANSAYMRTSWDPDEAVYINYTNNPSNGHAHPDLNQVLLYAYGQPLLVDSGRYGYSGGSLYDEFRTAQAHNTIEADGINMGSTDHFHDNTSPLKYTVTNDVFDFASSSHKNFVSNNINHTRNVLFLRKGFAIVSDYVTGDSSKTYHQNWHFLPSSNASAEGNVIKTDFYKKANVVMVAASADSAEIKSGYHSADYGLASVSEFGAYGKTGKDIKFDTILYPVKAGESANITATDLAPSDSSKGAVQFSGDVNALYYVKNTDESDGNFGNYNTDAKTAYVDETTALIVEGKTLTGGAIEIESPIEISGISVSLENGVLAVNGDNLMATTDKGNAIAIKASGVSSVTLNGETVDTLEENGVIYAVSVASVTYETVIAEVTADKDGFVASNYGNEGATNTEIIQAARSWQNRNAYAAFDLTDYAAEDFNKAVLKMTVTEAASGATVHFYFLDYGDWTRDNLSFILDSSKMPTHTNADSGTFTGFSYHFTGDVSGISAGNEFEVDFTSQLKEYLEDGGSPKFTLAMLSETGSTKFASINNTSYDGPTIELSNKETVGVTVDTSVTVSFVDSEGNPLAEDVEIRDGITVGEIYVYDAEELMEVGGVKYALDDKKSNIGVLVEEGENSVTAVYTKAAEVKVNFVCDGKTVAEGETGYCFPGKAYSYAPDVLYIFDGNAYLTDTDSSVLSVDTVYGGENVITVALDAATLLSENLASNGSFDSGIDGWYSVGKDNLVQTNTDGEIVTDESSFDGASYRQKTNDGGTSGCNIYGQFSLGDDVQAGDRYILVFRRNGNGGDSITLTLGLCDNFYAVGNTVSSGIFVDESCGGLGNSGTSPVSCNITGLATDEWQQLGYILTAGEASKYAVFYGRWCGGQMFDDFMLYKIESDSFGVDVTIKYVNDNGDEIASAKTVKANIGETVDAADYNLCTVWKESGVIYTFDADATGETTITAEKGGVNEIKLVYAEKEYDGVVLDLSFDDEETGFSGGLGKTLAVGSTSLADGVSGKALSLGGSTYLKAVMSDSGNSLLTGMDEITIVYYNKVDNTDTNWTFFAAPNTDAQTYSNEHYLGGLEKGGSFTVERYNNSGSRPSNASTAVTDGWKQVAVVVSKDNTEIYIDGEKKAEQASSYLLSDILGDSSVLQIGKANWGSGEFYSGLIDEFKIYDRAFTAEEIASLADGYSLAASLGWDEEAKAFTIDFMLGEAFANGSYTFNMEGQNSFTASANVEITDETRGISFETTNTTRLYKATAGVASSGAVSVYGLVVRAIIDGGFGALKTIDESQVTAANEVLNSGGIYLVSADGGYTLPDYTSELMTLTSEGDVYTVTLTDDAYGAGLRFSAISAATEAGSLTPDVTEKAVTINLAESTAATADLADINAALMEVELVFAPEAEEEALSGNVDAAMDFEEIL